MLKMSRRKLVLLVTLSVFCNAANCIAAEGSPRWLVSPKLLEHGGLEILWDNKLPIKSPENLERLFILGNRIYALSDRNYMAALNREKGNVIFGRPIAAAGFPVLGLELYKDELFSIIGNKLVQINPEFGTELSAKRLAFGSVCPAARNISHFYLGGVDRRMHALRAEDKVQVFEASAENDSMITSIVANDNSVVFATDAGNVICITPDRTRQLWQFEAAGGIAPPIVRDDGSLFLASKDTNIYRINARTGKLVWKYQTAAMLDSGPRVTQDVVYQYVRDEGLAAIDRGTGQLIWQWDEGIDLLAEADEKTYLITNNGKLVVMDNKKAKQLYSVNFAGVSRHAANVSDSKIYIADKTGRIACLKPIK